MWKGRVSTPVFRIRSFLAIICHFNEKHNDNKRDLYDLFQQVLAHGTLGVSEAEMRVCFEG